MTAVAAPPMGHMGALFERRPARRPSSFRVVDASGRAHPPVRDLPVAAVRAVTYAERDGRAWLAGSDGTHCEIDADGAVTPHSGWAATAARVIRGRNTP